ncbi:MAG: hypothetical protein RLZZ211_986 [Bacteroidota bacterium]|jgi:hypothetical protein
MKTTQLFKSNEQQIKFEKDGFILIPMLDNLEVADLVHYYASLQLKKQDHFGFHVSMDRLSEEQCAQIRAKIYSVILPKLDAHLENYKPFVANYIVKENYSLGFVPLHQDWTFVDKEEEGYTSITCWTALVDITIESGCMGLIKGSNAFLQNFRPSPAPQTPIALNEHKFSLFPYLMPIEMKAGETLFFDNRTFHASPPNNISEQRLVASIGITQKEAQLVHYYLKPDGHQNKILKYAVDEDFFLKYYNGRLSKMYDRAEFISDYAIVAELDYAAEPIQAEEIINKTIQAGNKYNENLSQKLNAFLNQENSPTFFDRYSPSSILRQLKHKLTRFKHQN